MLKKDIDRLFQEKFKNFEQQPNAKIWSGIDSQLKATAKFSFLNYKLLGFAVAIVLFLGLWQLVKTDKSTTTKENMIWLTNTSKQKKKATKENAIQLTNTNKQNKGATNKTKIIQSEKRVELNIATPNQENLEFSLIPSVKAQQRNNTSKIDENFKVLQGQISKSSNSVMNNSHNSKLTTAKPSNKKGFYNAQILNSNITTITNDRIKSTKDLVLYSSLKIAPIFLKNVNFKAIDLSNKKIDIQPLVKEDKTLKSKKWELSPVVSPIFYASVSEGSPIDTRISKNEKVGSVTYSYGLDLAFNLNDKWSLKTGIHTTDLSYKTTNVGIVFDVVIDPHTQTSNVNKGSVSMYNANEYEEVNFIGDVRQDLNYIQIPLEFKYKLVTRKITGININGGFSTLVLNGNSISFETDSIRNFDLGETTNINNLSFTANLGFSTYFKTAENWLFHISPSFKYQLNPYTNDAGGYKPYFLGVNTGLSYKF